MKNYCVYKHTCPNEKVYIGITCIEPKKRWSNGHGYRNQHVFYKAIQEYGWKNMKHEIIFNNLTKEEAIKLEIETIKKYDSTNKEKGYNRTTGGRKGSKKIYYDEEYNKGEFDLELYEFYKKLKKRFEKLEKGE